LYTNMALKLESKLKIPENIQVHLEQDIVTVTGPKGETQKQLKHPLITITLSQEFVHLATKGATRNNKKILNTFAAHIKNLLKGVAEGYQYELKICSGHFPMTVLVEGSQVIIKNFLGEKIPRKANIVPGVQVSIKGNDIFVSGINKEHVSATASNLESSTRITNRDRRIFMDGLWITSKAGKII